MISKSILIAFSLLIILNLSYCQQRNLQVKITNQQSDRKAVHEFLNQQRGAHLYTSDQKEKDTSVVGKILNDGYTYIGPVFNIFTTKQSNMGTIFRYVNPTSSFSANNQYFLYTSDPNEVGTTQVGKARNNWLCLGSIGYVYLEQQENTKPLFRIRKNLDYVLTTDTNLVGTMTPGTLLKDDYEFVNIIGYVPN